ncbi:MAG: glucose-6-phosphate isomerase [Clostridia bacterium]
MITFNKNYATKFIDESKVKKLLPLLKSADEKIKNKSGLGNDFVGWIDLPENYDRDEVERIKTASKKIQKNSDIIIVIGIGGSYLGAKAALDFLKTPYYNSIKKDTPDIYFLGNSFSGEELSDVLSLCDKKRISMNVISKSGTTTESSVAFRIIREYLESRYTSDELKDRIFVTTDKAHGALLNFAKAKEYECFVIPDDIGGRFSVLTAVGLLPLAICGCDIDKLLLGAKQTKDVLFSQGISNGAYEYALMRNYFLQNGKSVEMLISYDPYLRSFAEWWKQLFGESEGKNGRGIFPASAVFSTDLHSMGQYIQDGQRIIFETVIKESTPIKSLKIVDDPENLDGLNFLSKKTMFEVNNNAFWGTTLAHSDGGTPTLVIEFQQKNELVFGGLCYFFFIACAASAYMLGVNPFNQPGVEEYKKNMFALLRKPGYENLYNSLTQKIETILK